MSGKVKEKVKEESVIKLSGEWDKLNTRFAELSFDAEDFNTLLITTTKIILSGQWIKGSRISESVKSNLTASVQRFCGLIKNRAASTIKNGPRREMYDRIATNLLSLFKDPWPNYIQDRLKNFSNLSIDDALDVWRKEGNQILKIRIEMMVKASMFYEAICLSKLGYLIGQAMHFNEESKEQCQLLLKEFNSEEYAIEPFFLSKDMFFRYHDIYFILILFEEDHEKYQIDKWISSNIIRNVLCRLQEPYLLPEDNDRICPNWVGWTLKEKIANGLVNISMRMIWKVLKGQDLSVSQEDLKILFLYTFILLSSNPTETPSHDSKLIVNIFSHADQIVEIEHVYALAETIFEHYERDNAIDYPNKLFMDLHIRALTEEVNRLEAAKILHTHNEEKGKENENENEKGDKIQELQKHLSEKYELLGDYLTSFPYTSFQLNLTSFSLKPTQLMFDKLFGPNHNHYYSNTDTLHEFDRLQLNQTLLEDFSSIIKSPRLSSLSWTKDINDLENKCKIHLETLGKNIIGRKRHELKYLEVDYSKYQDKDYNLDDDDGGGGYEKGYSPNNPRFKKKLPISQQIKLQRKNMDPLLILKNNPQLYENPTFMNLIKRRWIKTMIKNNINANNNNHNVDNDSNLPQRNINFIKRVNFYSKYSNILNSKSKLKMSKFKSSKKKQNYTRIEQISNFNELELSKEKLNYVIRLNNDEHYGIPCNPSVNNSGLASTTTSLFINSPIFSDKEKIGPEIKKKNKVLLEQKSLINDSTIFNKVPLFSAMPTISSMPSSPSILLSQPQPPSKEIEIVISNATDIPQNSIIKLELTDSFSPGTITSSSSSVSGSLSKESSQSHNGHDEEQDQINKSNITDKLNGEVIEP